MENNVKGMVKGEIKVNADMIREECERAKSVIISGLLEPDMESAVKRQDHIRAKVQQVFDKIKDAEDK